MYTNSLAMLTDLSRARDVTVYILGGRYNPDLYSLQGSLAEQVLENAEDRSLLHRRGCRGPATASAG